MKRTLGFLVIAATVATTGCGGEDKPTYANVKGTVNYNGKPIPKGQVTFALEGRPPSTMDITDGKFAGQAMVGSNKVMVSAKKQGNAPKLNADANNQIKGYMERMKSTGGFGSPPADYDPNMIEYIPEDWGAASKQMFVVEAKGANEFTFEIKGK